MSDSDLDYMPPKDATGKEQHDWMRRSAERDQARYAALMEIERSVTEGMRPKPHVPALRNWVHGVEVPIVAAPDAPPPAVTGLKVYRQDPTTGIWVHDESFITTAVPAGTPLSAYAAGLPRVVGRLLDPSEYPF